MDGDGVDIYVIDSGVRGASRPTGNNAALHPELYDPDFVSDLNGTAEQQNYRVFQLVIMQVLMELTMKMTTDMVHTVLFLQQEEQLEYVRKAKNICT